MTNQQGCFVLLALLIWGVSACKKKVEAEYEQALEEGVVLVQDDTIQVPLHQTILFDFSFADGVNPIHYTWDIYQLDSSKFQYLETKDFHFAEPEIVGGPAAGIHSYKVLKEGTYKLVFYNPHYNEEELLKQQQADDPFLTWKALKEDFSAYDSLTDWNRTTFEEQWLALQEAEAQQKEELWKELYFNTYSIDSMPDSITTQTLLQTWAEQYTPYTTSAPTLEMLDTLFGKATAPNSKAWQAFRQQQQQLPLHPNTPTQTYYVRVIAE